MNINDLIKTIDLSAQELKKYVHEEIEEFLAADTLTTQQQEYQDILFALKNLAYAHTNTHLEVDEKALQDKFKKRLETYGAISKKQPVFSHNSIKKLQIGVVHIAPGTFKQPWSHFEPFKNGTEAEIAALTDNPYQKENQYTNHVIITYDDVDELTYEILTSNWTQREQNIILCRIPDFIYTYAKTHDAFDTYNTQLGMQLYAAINQLNLHKETILHFHSWEAAIPTRNLRIQDLIQQHKSLFSPYLTVSRLQEFYNTHKSLIQPTLSAQETQLASNYEHTIASQVDAIIVESSADQQHYQAHTDKPVNKYAYTDVTKHRLSVSKHHKDTLHLIAGGRPVDEKGFVELINQAVTLKQELATHNKTLKLDIYCKEYDRKTGELKKTRYINKLQETIRKHNLLDEVTLHDKVSLQALKDKIQKADLLVVPSLYDPYCLMPEYAMQVDTPSMVSIHAGIAEHINNEYVYDPTSNKELTNKIIHYLQQPADFIFDNTNTSYKTLYIS